MSDESALGVKMDADMKRQIRVAAAKRDMSMSEFVRTVVRAELENNEGNPTMMTIPS